jgi:hypothetical protein
MVCVDRAARPVAEDPGGILPQGGARMRISAASGTAADRRSVSPEDRHRFEAEPGAFRVRIPAGCPPRRWCAQAARTGCVAEQYPATENLPLPGTRASAYSVSRQGEVPAYFHIQAESFRSAAAA